ncbi:MAG: MerR family DNA-binding transcriptional regulator, partial [Candidatus Levybacteria bacterium]|nr:MerR family DNA-binding transcriptional regulator [Candidatus Levybacteria bacterium]
MDQDKLLSIQQAAQILKVSTKTLRRWEERGILIPQRTDGNHRRYTEAQIDSFWQGIHEKKTATNEPIDLLAIYPPVNITKTIVEKSTKTEKFGQADRSLSLASKKKILLVSAFASIISLLTISTILAVTFLPLKPKTDQQKSDLSQKLREDVLGLTVGRAKYLFRVNVPSSFSQEAEFLKGVSISGIATSSGGIDTQNSDVNAGSGSVFASNLIYGLVAGDGISIGAGQTPTVTNTGVLSVGGETGTVTLKAGTGISISGNTITNSSPDTTSDTFKNIKIGSDTITASGTNDSLTVSAGTNITLSANTTTKTLTINSTASSTGSNWTLGAGFLTPNNSTVDLLIGGQSTASAKLGFLNVNSGTPTASISANSGNNALYLTGDGTLATTNRGTITIGSSSTYNTSGDILLAPNGTGNVGIGTTGSATGVKLNVLGSIAAGTAISGTSDVNDVLTLTRDTDVTVLVLNRNSSSSYQSQISFRQQSGPSAANEKWAIGVDSNGNNTNDMYFYSGVAPTGVKMTILSSGNVGIGTTSPISALHVTKPLSFGATGKALAIFDQIENQDILTASASGTTRFTITNPGGIKLGTNEGTNGDCLISGGVGATASWGSCVSGGSGANNWWQLNSGLGTLTTGNQTVDLLIGSSNGATTSAKFAFLNVSGGTPTASISANSGNNATTLTGTGVLATANMQTLALGNSTTGNIVIDSGSGSITLSDNTDLTTNLLINIGNAGTDFTSGGGLTLAGT